MGPGPRATPDAGGAVSLSIEMREHPRVKAALDKASEVIWAWVEREAGGSKPEGVTQDGLVALLSWWPGVDLQERIAVALLHASGWDVDVADAVMDRRQPGEPIGDVLARIDTILAMPEADGDAALEALPPVAWPVRS